MKNSNLNFRTPLYTILALTFLLFTACQKEGIDLAQAAKAPIISTETTTKINELDLSDLEEKLNSNARMDAQAVSIMSEVIHVTHGGPYLLAANIENLPDPNTHRIEVTVIPFDKPTDLVLQSFNPNRNPTHLSLKESRNQGMDTDVVKYRRTDFIAGETNAVLSIEWEGEGNKFELKINAIPVDCQEERPRNEGDVGIEFQPVCGCDGRTYFDATSAYNAGITRYTRGRCLPNLNIPVDGLWESLEINWPQYQLYIEDDCISYTLIGEKDGVVIKICDEYEEDKEEGRTWTVVDEKKNGFLFWPVEKWSAQVNTQGELEIYRSNGADKDKKDNKTIMHRFKRIK